MNGNSSKQVLLSVLGIAILVVAVVGVSFAFFSYTKQGNTNNTIKTGEIYTYLNEGADLVVSNAFPQLSAPADIKGANAASTDDVGYLKFTVTGKNSSATGGETITYKVYVLEGTTIPNGGSVRMFDTEVSAKLFTANSDTAHSTITAADGVTDGRSTESGEVTAVPFPMSTITGRNTSVGKLADRTAISGGVLLATGTFAPGADAVHTYELNMYVNDTVKISDTETTVNGSTTTKYCAKDHVGNPQTDITITNGYNGCELYYPTGSNTVTKLQANETLVASNPEEGQVAGEYLPEYTDAYYSIRIRVVANTDSNNTAYDYNGGQP